MARIVPGNRFFYFLKIFTQSDDESQILKLGMQDNSLVDYDAATFGVPLRTYDLYYSHLNYYTTHP